MNINSCTMASDDVTDNDVEDIGKRLEQFIQ
jgi:hypothetical protein